jgi:nitrogenase molybdenum-iron protein alpha/beta subunit
VVNSPGAALIGDDTQQFLAATVKDIPYLSIENTGYSGSFGSGFQNAIIKMIDALDIAEADFGDFGDFGICSESSSAGAVNLLGISIYQKYYDNNYKALRRLLDLCGIEVITAFGAGDTVADIYRAREADLNVVLCPEYGIDVAKKLDSEWNQPYIIAEAGPPIGFDATTTLIEQICTVLGADPTEAVCVIQQARAKAYLYLARFSSLLGLPKGAEFSIKGEASTVYALTHWLCSYLGMIPVAVSILPEDSEIFVKRLSTFLDSIHRVDVLGKSVVDTPSQIIFADGSAIAAARLSGQKCCGVEIGLPTLGYLDITDKYLYAEQGALFLLEQIINGLRYV